MVTAIVLVKADIQRIPEVAEMIAQIAEVSEVYSVTGEFDLVAMIRVRGHDQLADVIPAVSTRCRASRTPRRTSRSAPTPGMTSRPPSPWARPRPAEPPKAGTRRNPEGHRRKAGTRRNSGSHRRKAGTAGTPGRPPPAPRKATAVQPAPPEPRKAPPEPRKAGTTGKALTERTAAAVTAAPQTSGRAPRLSGGRRGGEALAGLYPACQQLRGGTRVNRSGGAGRRRTARGTDPPGDARPRRRRGPPRR